jgi:hypothetical protein
MIVKAAKKRTVKKYRVVSNNVQKNIKNAKKTVKSSIKASKVKKPEVVVIKKNALKLLGIVALMNLFSLFIVVLLQVKKLDVIVELTLVLFLIASQVISFIAVFIVYSWFLNKKVRRLAVKI